MSLPTILRACVAFGGALFAALSLPAQDDSVALARAFVAAQAPATDDPDQVAADLVAAGLAHARSPIAGFLVAEAGRYVGIIQDPQRLLTQLDGAASAKSHGLCLQETAILRWRLLRALGRDAGRFPVFGHAESMLACGPFGDPGDHYVGVAFAPELEFPAAGATFEGRGGEARCVVLSRRGDSRGVDLAQPPRWLAGCQYGRWRIQVAADTEGFLEIEHDGDFQVFVDGKEVLRLERWRRTTSFRQHQGLHLPAGGHEIVVKTATNGRSFVCLRVVDGEGHALAGVQTAADEGFTPAATAASATKATFVTGEAMLARLASAMDADATLRLAAVLAALREGNQDRALDLAAPLRATPPTDGTLALATARVLRLLPLPDELRKAEARKLEEAAFATLPPTHHAARLARAALAEEQDRREDALQILAEHAAPGPETHARRCDVLRNLKFFGELDAALHAFAAACPRDCRPPGQLAADRAGTRATAHLLELRQRSLALRKDQPGLAQAACRDAIALGRFDDAAKLLELAFPTVGDAPTVSRLRMQLDLAHARGDARTKSAVRQQLFEHAAIDAEVLHDLAAAYHQDGDAVASAACLERARELGGARHGDASWRLDRGGAAATIDALASLRRDGRMLALAFQAGEREQGSSTTVLLDQRIAVMQPDGSSVTEVHSLRRINDQAGVERFGEKLGLGGVGEVLLVRTLDAEGNESIPSRIDGDYSLTRLQPGAFVEWRYRDHQGAPGDGELAQSPFHFGAEDEPCVLAELVLVPPSGRGELRTRGLGEPVARTPLADGRTALTFTRSNLPAMPKEQFLPPMLELLPSAEIGEDSTPFPVLRNHRAQLGRRTRTVQPLLDAAAVAIAGTTTPREQAFAIWAFCQERIEDGNADGALETLLRKKGSRFLLAIAMMRAAGLQVVPMACTGMRPELGDGTASLFTDTEPVQLPGAMLLLPDGTRVPMFVDTPRHWPLGMVPAQRGGTRAILIHDDRFEPTTLPAATGGSQRMTVRGDATLRGKDLVLTATAELGDIPGYTLAERLRQQKEAVQKQAARQIAQQIFPGFRVESARFVGTDKGKPLAVEATLKGTGVQKNGDRFVVPLPLPPTKFATSYGDRAERTMPWRLPVDLDSDWDVTFDPGTELRLAKAPTSIVCECEPLHFDQRITLLDGRVRIQRTVRMHAATRPAVAFADWLRTLGDADRAEAATIELLPRAR